MPPSQSADIPWNPRTGRQVDAGGLWTQVTAITPVALSASTCPGKHAELQPDSKHLNGFPGFNCTCATIYKQSVSQKRGKIQTAWQYVVPEAKMTPDSSKSKAPRERKGGPKCQPGRGANMQRTKQSRGCSRQQKSVPKSTRNADCIGGRDFRAVSYTHLTLPTKA